MCDVGKQDAELRQKSTEKLRGTTDPLETLKLKLLSRGSSSIKGMARYVDGHYFNNK